MHKNPLSRVVFVLVEPSTAGNVGAVCRLAKNFGIGQIRVVQSTPINYEEAQRFAWGSKDILQNVGFFDTFDAAIADLEILIGTTNRRRRNQVPLYTPKELGTELQSASKKGQIGVLFGRENNGLHHEELLRCHYLSRIPIRSSYPAINLSHAAMIYAYELSQSLSGPSSVYGWRAPKETELGILYEKLESVIAILPFRTRHGNKAFTDLFRRIFGRARLEERDVRLFLKIFSGILNLKKD